MNEEIINYYSENNFELENSSQYTDWILSIASSEGKKIGEISFIFCDDNYLLEINKKFLDHDTYTDIISFDNTVGNILNGDVFISTERVFENALQFQVSFEKELLRVMAHGLLHFCGYNDKTSEDSSVMRVKEDEKMEMFHVEQ